MLITAKKASPTKDAWLRSVTTTLTAWARVQADDPPYPGSTDDPPPPNSLTVKGRATQLHLG